MPVVAIGLVFETDVGLVEAEGAADRPILVNPAAVGRDRQGRREQSSERPVEPVFRNIAALGWVTEVALKRQDCFIGDRRIVHRQRAVEIAIAGDAMGVRLLTKQQPRHRRGTNLVWSKN
jgi:hypothetical protein